MKFLRSRLTGFFLFIAFLASAQSSITGKVINLKTREPIAFASVYISGTKNGVYTDGNGNFTLSHVTPPCELVVSHVSYGLKVISVNEVGVVPLTIAMTEKNRQLEDVYVKGQSRREENLKEFRLYFLGTDISGKSAEIMNDEVLYFSKQTDTLVRKPDETDSLRIKYNKPMPPNQQWSADSSMIITYIDNFNVRTTAPLHVKLPFQGYEVFLDMDSFSVSTDNQMKLRKYSLFSRFIPMEPESQREALRLEKNRELVYYNSSRHFCKSLFKGALSDNGYLVYLKTVENTGTQRVHWALADLSPFIHAIDSNRIEVTGLKGRQLVVYYFCKSNGRPISVDTTPSPDGSSNIPWTYHSPENLSFVTFLSDNCVIYRNGLVLDSNILFGGTMGSKCGGALLPIDYQPVENTNSPNGKDRTTR